MTEQEENDLIEWMEGNRKEHLIICARELKEYCANKECESCVFYSQKECEISPVNPCGGTVPPEDWEV